MYVLSRNGGTSLQKLSTMGLLIRRYRKWHRLTQSELSKQCGWGLSSMQKLEYGQRFPDAVTMITLMQKLEIPLAEVLEAYDHIDDQDFIDANTTRKITLSMVSGAFQENFQKDTDINHNLLSVFPEYLQSVINSVYGGACKATLITALTEQQFGCDPLTQNILKQLFDPNAHYSIQRCLIDLFTGLASADLNYTEKNRMLIELAQRMAFDAEPIQPQPYDAYVLAQALQEIAAQLRLMKRRSEEAKKLNNWISKNVETIGISPLQFDYQHFTFQDETNFIKNDTIEYLEQTASNLQQSNAKMFNFGQLYDAILTVWPYIYNIRASYCAVLEMEKLQPANSYPTATPEVLEQIRITVKKTVGSLRK